MPHMDYAIQVLQMVVDDVGDDVFAHLCHDSFHVISFSFFTLFYAVRVLAMHRLEVLLVRLYHIDVMFQVQ